MNEDGIKWSAPEHDHREHSTDWYWVVGIITFSVATALFIAGNLLLSIIIIIGIGTLMIHTVQTPRYFEYQISEHGIRAHKKFYYWDSLESFWILEATTTEGGAVGAQLLLTSKKHFMPFIVIPLGNTSLEEIRVALLTVLPEEPRVEPFPDRIMRKLGF
ncbi:MAG: hypothetical protein AAB628_03080 [Patescibacteria group bacterium]